MLTWTKDRDDTERLTVGNMAKYTLASNAARDADLLAMLKQGLDRQPADIQPALKEVIEAAETMEIAHIRKAALASIEDLKRKGPGYKRDISTWGQFGQGAVALGCIAAAAAGQVEIGIPCVVGGALSSAALNYWGKD
jgi:TRAP-type C4-dicarboxylate transport system substrate-binding protein